MSSSVEVVYRSKVFFSACNCVVDVLLLKGPLVNQLQVALHEPLVAAGIHPLVLNYSAVVKRLDKHFQQLQINVVLDSGYKPASCLEQIQTLVRKKAIFDLIVSGLHIVYDAKEEKIMKVDSKFSIKRNSFSPESDPSRSLSAAATRMSSFLGKMFSTNDSESNCSMIDDSSHAHVNITTKTEAGSESSISCAIHATSSSATAEPPNKYSDPSSTPAKRLAQHLLKRLNTSSASTEHQQLKDSSTLGSDKSSVTLSVGGGGGGEIGGPQQSSEKTATDIYDYNVCTRQHPSMLKPAFLQDLSIITNLPVDDDEEDDSASGQEEQGGEQGKEGPKRVGVADRQIYGGFVSPPSVQQNAQLSKQIERSSAKEHNAASGGGDISMGCDGSSTAPPAVGTSFKSSGKGVRLKPSARTEPTTAAVGAALVTTPTTKADMKGNESRAPWWVSAVFARLTAKNKATVHAE